MIVGRLKLKISFFSLDDNLNKIKKRFKAKHFSETIE
jgi:hypothetical protein